MSQNVAHRRVAVIMAGGSGERFWPVSVPDRPKQFLRLADPHASLLQQAVRRAGAIVGLGETYIATGRGLVEMSAAECPELPRGNLFAEPCRKNTAGCLAWVAANLIAANPDSWPTMTIAVLTADHRIGPADRFAVSLTKAFETAERTGGLVTMGIPPTRPETGFGYIEVGEPDGNAFRVLRFREKPDEPTAQEFLEHGGFLWNSGMFVWTLPAYVAETERADPVYAEAVREMAAALARGDAQAAEEVFGGLQGISIDYALMEKAERVFVVKAEFQWDDLGAWDSLERSLEPDEAGNVSVGGSRLLDCSGMVTYDATGKTEICVLGCHNLVVTVAEGKVLVVPKALAQSVKRFQAG
ncbi:MAG: mannose-1-phosphate guanylyltransferase [Fimbriimonadaceae bacterium]